MELKFEIVEEISEGNHPDVVHLPSNEVNIIRVRNGKLYNTVGKITGGWENIELIDDVILSRNQGITNLRIETLGGFGAVGCYKTGDSHVLILAEYEYGV